MTKYVCMLREIPGWVSPETAGMWIGRRQLPFYNDDGCGDVEESSKPLQEMVFPQRNVEEADCASAFPVDLDKDFEAALVKLLNEIQNDNIQIKGKKTRVAPHGFECLAFGNADQWDEVESIGWEDIPGSLWSIHGYRRGKDQLITTEGVFSQLKISMQDLLKRFPPYKIEYVELALVDGFLLYDDKVKATKTSSKMKRERKPKYDWDAFYCQAVRLARSDKLGKTQAAAVSKLSEWCIKRWGDSPSDTQIKSKISPIYQFSTQDKPTKKES